MPDSPQDDKQEVIRDRRKEARRVRAAPRISYSCVFMTNLEGCPDQRSSGALEEYVGRRFDYCTSTGADSFFFTEDVLVE
jgi:hypothetical protein